jgi:signal transduction histidine kinase
MPLKNMPIRRKLMVIILVTTVTALVLMRSVSLAYEFFTFRQALLQHLSIVGEVIAANSTAALAFDDQNGAEENLAALKAEKSVSLAALYDESGKLFATYPADAQAAAFPPRSGKTGYRYQRLSISGFQPVVQNDKHLGTLYLHLDARNILRHWFWNSIAIALAVIAIAFVVAYLLSKVLQKQISRPILALAETATSISHRRDYSVRATRPGNDEVGLLTDAFNHMLAQIQELNQELEERVVKRTKELEIANKELEAFSYSVSHDLRTPLRAMDGFSQAVLDEYGPQLPEEGQRYLRTIRRAAQRMGALIDDLLTFSRLSRVPLQRQPIDTARLVDEAMEELSPQGEGRQIDFRVGELPVCEGDPALMRQVWLNLLSNALKYTQKRQVALVEVGFRQENGQGVYFVSDNGTGFDMRYSHKLFGVFQRLHRADEFEGTGVGLAIVQRVVQRHGGSIWAEAAVDRGAAFSFTLGEERNHD